MPCPKEFKSNKSRLKFYLFNFHDKFDCLLGLDNLRRLKATIDLRRDLLIMHSCKVNIEYPKLTRDKSYVCTASQRDMSKRMCRVNEKNSKLNSTKLGVNQETKRFIKNNFDK